MEEEAAEVVELSENEAIEDIPQKSRSGRIIRQVTRIQPVMEPAKKKAKTAKEKTAKEKTLKKEKATPKGNSRKAKTAQVRFESPESNYEAQSTSTIVRFFAAKSDIECQLPRGVVYIEELLIKFNPHTTSWLWKNYVDFFNGIIDIKGVKAAP
ncbi:hypothetical protein M422DRAFT_267150 [Sphaerobolus stellatus SS14]|uniref:Uncharacterized protein n=1 Tax=Sphaerobolus stellatus (strain SS14) TaxID=990650 RepID=A0A0C9V173_SPHS4|nr:hypothetical protein M422DRAFT_267150 [Sphaerobolus stellatus SS14]